MKKYSFNDPWWAWSQNFDYPFCVFFPSFWWRWSKVYLKGVHSIYSCLWKSSSERRKWIYFYSLSYRNSRIFKSLETIKIVFFWADLSHWNLVIWNICKIVWYFKNFNIIKMCVYLIYEECFIFFRTNKKKTYSISYLCDLKTKWFSFVFSSIRSV